MDEDDWKRAIFRLDCINFAIRAARYMTGRVTFVDLADEFYQYAITGSTDPEVLHKNKSK